MIYWRLLTGLARIDERRRERTSRELFKRRADVASQVAYVRSRCCADVLRVVDLALADGRLDAVAGYPAEITFVLVADSERWLLERMGSLNFFYNPKTMHDRWLGYAACERGHRGGGIVFVDT